MKQSQCLFLASLQLKQSTITIWAVCGTGAAVGPKYFLHKTPRVHTTGADDSWKEQETKGSSSKGVLKGNDKMFIQLREVEKKKMVRQKELLCLLLAILFTILIDFFSLFSKTEGNTTQKNGK